MDIYEEVVSIPWALRSKSPIVEMEKAVQALESGGFVPIRCAVVAMAGKTWEIEVGCLKRKFALRSKLNDSIFRFSRRRSANASDFNVVVVVPTGIGAEIGGHAGDSTPVARLVGEVCDVLITHPNVVNASDLNEMPSNALYVEGSVLSRFLMGTIGLEPVRSNRVLVIIEEHPDEYFVSSAINTVEAARATYGFQCNEVVRLAPSFIMDGMYTKSGRAGGIVRKLEYLFNSLEERRGSYDAVAITSVVNVPDGMHCEYFRSKGKMVNPWGGVEALLTHAVSSCFDVPSAHAPMMENRELMNTEFGVVDPRMAAEAISLSFLQCALKGLYRAPRIVVEDEEMKEQGILTVRDVACVILPDKCVGLATLAALEQGIHVIAVRENDNLMRNRLRILPWAPGQLYIANNYLEAVGMLACIKAGINPTAVQRPMRRTTVQKIDLSMTTWDLQNARSE